MQEDQGSVSANLSNISQQLRCDNHNCGIRQPRKHLPDFISAVMIAGVILVPQASSVHRLRMMAAAIQGTQNSQIIRHQRRKKMIKKGKDQAAIATMIKILLSLGQSLHNPKTLRIRESGRASQLSRRILKSMSETVKARPPATTHGVKYMQEIDLVESLTMDTRGGTVHYLSWGA